MIYDSGVSAIQRQSAALLHTQQQLSSGRRMLTPADDPVAAARALDLTQSSAITAQYGVNQNNARDTLSLVEGQLTAAGELIQLVRERAVQAGNTVLSDGDRRGIAAELRGQYEQLMGLANSTDGSGQYLFSGYQGDTKPFSGNVATSVIYAGDDGQRLLQVSASRQMAVSDSGNDVFMRIRNGNGTFAARANAVNGGSGVIDAGFVYDNSLLSGDTYEIRFTSQTTYDIFDVSTATNVSTGNAFTAGTAISFLGMTVTISGSPASGDAFSLTPSANQSLFQTLGNLITALETPLSGSAPAKTRLANGIGAALTDLDQAQENILRVRTTIGSRQLEIDALSSTSEDLAVQYAATLSRLQDVDYAAAISKLTQEQSYLEAAQQSFLRVAGLSLFNYV